MCIAMLAAAIGNFLVVGPFLGQTDAGPYRNEPFEVSCRVATGVV